MNLRKQKYATLVALRVQPLGKYYERFLRETQEGMHPDTSKNLPVQLLTHCKQFVPYYFKIISTGCDYYALAMQVGGIPV